MNTTMNVLKWIAFSLILIGGINWGLIGAFDFNLIGYLFGEMSIVSRIIYLIVGISAICYTVLVLMDRYNEDTSCFN